MAVAVQILFGGGSVVGEVRVNGEELGDHWWNRLVGGVDLDLAGAPFGPDERIAAGWVVV